MFFFLKRLKEVERIRLETTFRRYAPSLAILANEVEIPELGMLGEKHEDCPFLSVSVPTSILTMMEKSRKGRKYRALGKIRTADLRFRKPRVEAGGLRSSRYKIPGPRVRDPLENQRSSHCWLRRLILLPEIHINRYVFSKDHDRNKPGTHS